MTDKDKGEEIFQKVIDHVIEEGKFQEQVYIANGHVIVNVNYEYSIPFQDIATYELILARVVHLAEKPWFKKEHIQFFVKTACEAVNINEPRQ